MCLLVWRENSWPMLAGCKWQLLFCFTGTAPAASEQKPHRRHQRRDVHQPSLERQPACLAGVIDIDDCGHNCRKRNLADCSTLVLARAWAPRCKFQLIASYDSIYHHITSILYHRLSSIDMYQCGISRSTHFDRKWQLRKLQRLVSIWRTLLDVHLQDL